MPVKFVDKHMVGFMKILEAEEGFLLCGRTVSDAAVFDHFHEALACMDEGIGKREIESLPPHLLTQRTI